MLRDEASQQPVLVRDSLLKALHDKDVNPCLTHDLRMIEKRGVSGIASFGNGCAWLCWP